MSIAELCVDTILHNEQINDFHSAVLLDRRLRQLKLMCLVEHLACTLPSNGNQLTIGIASDSPAHFKNDKAAYQAARDYYDKSPAMNAPREHRSLIDDGLDHFAGAFYPGSQAPLVDLMQDPEVGEILRHFYENAQPGGPLRHGSIALAAATDDPRAFRAAHIAGNDAKASE